MSAKKNCVWLEFPENPALATSIRAKALVFSDPESKKLLQFIEKLAPSEAPVLIEGETGTGKELVARHIHQHSKRSGPFLAVNCGGFSETLVEAELFGHEAGAFTGAQGARAGWFEAAKGGTLFLDEIGDLPQAMQVKLLRILQEKEVTRIGSRKAIPVDVRIITATNVNLERSVSVGKFRMDLFYRINVARVKIPPLRERLSELQPLVRHFIRSYAKKMDITPAPELSENAWQILRKYTWPGNIRELENVIHFALLVCRNGTIEVEDLKLTLVDNLPQHSNHNIDPEKQLIQAIEKLFATNENLYEVVEEALTRWAFDRSQNNQVKAAQTLGVSRNTLRTLLKRHQLLVE